MPKPHPWRNRINLAVDQNRQPILSKSKDSLLLKLPGDKVVTLERKGVQTAAGKVYQ